MDIAGAPVEWRIVYLQFVVTQLRFVLVRLGTVHWPSTVHYSWLLYLVLMGPGARPQYLRAYYPCPTG